MISLIACKKEKLDPISSPSTIIPSPIDSSKQIKIIYHNTSTAGLIHLNGKVMKVSYNDTTIYVGDTITIGLVCIRPQTVQSADIYIDNVLVKSAECQIGYRVK